MKDSNISLPINSRPKRPSHPVLSPQLDVGRLKEIASVITRGRGNVQDVFLNVFGKTPYVSEEAGEIDPRAAED